jgi:hypothetical protein
LTAKRSAGFLVLAATCVLLFYYAFSEALSSGAALIIVLGIALLTLLVGLFHETKTITAASSGPVFPANDLYIFASVVVGSLVSYWLSVNMGLGSIVAAALVGVVGGTLLPAYGAPLYCGAFVGMASPKVLDDTQLLIAGVIAGIIYVLAQDVLNGFGGKFGTIACAGCIVAAQCFSKPLLSSAIPTWDVGKKIILTSVIAAVVTYLINVRMGKGGVLASGIVGLVGGLILPVLFPQIGGTLATVCICASFAGMSAKTRISNEILMAVVGVLVGLVFMYSSPHLGGAGGKLGTTAFGSVIVVSTIHRFKKRWMDKTL